MIGEPPKVGPQPAGVHPAPERPGMSANQRVAPTTAATGTPAQSAALRMLTRPAFCFRAEARSVVGGNPFPPSSRVIAPHHGRKKPSLPELAHVSSEFGERSRLPTSRDRKGAGKLIRSLAVAARKFTLHRL